MSGAEVTKVFESTAVNTFKLSDKPPVFMRGEGPWLYTDKDEQYLDLVCGSATSNLGHNHPEHIKAIKEVTKTGIFHTGTRLISPYRADLYQQLSEFMETPDISIHLSNSGSESIETAIKITRFITKRQRFISFEGGYHGRTLGALSVTHSEKIKSPFIGKIGDFVTFVPFPRKETEVGFCLEKCSEIFEYYKSIEEPIAGLIIEAVQGVSGVWGPWTSFLEGLEDLAKKHGSLFIADEIWSGLGRSGKKFSFNYSKISPDLIVLGKGLSSSTPLSAVIAKGDLLKSWTPGAHTSTFQGNPISCAAACATLKEIKHSSLLEHVNNSIEPCFYKLSKQLKNSGKVKSVRFVGAQCAIELDNSKTSNLVQNIALQQEKMLTYGGGINGECVLILPPLNIDKDLLEKALETLTKIITEELPKHSS